MKIRVRTGELKNFVNNGIVDLLGLPQFLYIEDYCFFTTTFKSYERQTLSSCNNTQNNLIQYENLKEKL